MCEVVIRLATHRKKVGNSNSEGQVNSALIQLVMGKSRNNSAVLSHDPKMSQKRHTFFVRIVNAHSIGQRGLLNLILGCDSSKAYVWLDFTRNREDVNGKRLEDDSETISS